MSQPQQTISPVTTTSVCLVAGNVHSGTTIASMLLGLHRNIFTAGALKRFPNGKQFSSTNRCTCGHHPSECEVWSAVLSELGLQPGDPDPDPRSVYAAIHKVTGKPLLLDCSHNAYRLQHLARELQHEQGIRLSVVLIERSALEIASIQIRTALRKKRVRNTFLARVKVITRGILMRRELLRTTSSLKSAIRVIKINYHDLCRNPDLTLLSIWEVLGQEADASMLAYEGKMLRVHKPEHMIHGNSRLRAQEVIHLKAMGINTSELRHYEKGYTLALNAISKLVALPSVRSMRRWLGHEG